MQGSDWTRRLRDAWSCELCRRHRLGLYVVLAVAAISWWLGT